MYKISDLYIRKETIPAAMINLPAKGHNAIQMAFCWRTDDGPLKKGIWILSLPSSTEKSCESWNRLTPLLDACMEEVPTTYIRRWLVCHMICLQTMKPNLSTCIKIGNTILAFIYIQTPGSDIMKFRTYTIASEEG